MGMRQGEVVGWGVCVIWGGLVVVRDEEGSWMVGTSRGLRLLMRANCPALLGEVVKQVSRR